MVDRETTALETAPYQSTPFPGAPLPAAPLPAASLKDQTIAILHYDLLGGGGAEVVAIAAIQALADAGASLVIYSSAPEAAVRTMLRKAIGPDLSFEYREIRIRLAHLLPKLLRIPLFNEALSHRVFTESVLFNTYSEFWLLHPHPAAFAYVHYPIFGTSWVSQGELRGLPARHPSSILGSAIAATIRLYVGLRRAVYPGFLLTNSDWTARRIAALYGEATVVYPPAAPQMAVANPDTLPADPIHIVSIGRLVPAKRLFWLATQMNAVAGEIGKRITFDIVGRGTPEYIQELKQSLATLPMIDAVIHADAPTPEKDRLLRSAHLGVHGFSSEHFGLAVAEMMTAGIPVLTPRNGGIGERLYECGQAFDDGNDFRKKLKSILTDPVLATELKRKNLAMSEEFTPASFARGIVDAVESRIPHPVVR